MTDIAYKIEELKEEGGALWARITLADNSDVDVPLASALEELQRKIEPYGLRQSEAISWMMTIPGIDEFFERIVEHKRRVLS